MRKANLLSIGTFFLLSSLPLLAAPIPPEIKSAAAFVYVPDAKGQLQPIGTGFFVSKPAGKDPNSVYIHFVTAKHVLQKTDKAGNKCWRSSFTLRLNKKDGGYAEAPLLITASGKKQTVFTHTDPNVDLAAVPILPNTKTIDFKTVPASWLTTKQDFQDLNISEGHEVFFTGLFSAYHGYKKNHPIVRFGRVALVTDEKAEWEKAPPWTCI